ncbi:MAG: porin [Sulfuritalea sp.]|nr:porin [Sulfuritalea sp.]
MTYANGPLKIGAIYAAISRRANNGNTGAGYTGTDTDIDEWGLGASYDFGVAKIYGRTKTRWTTHPPSASIGDNVIARRKYSTGVPPVLSKGAVSLGYAKSSVDVGNSDADAWALLFTYDLSKRTTLYTGYTALSNDGAAARGIVTGTTAITGIGQPMIGGDASVFAAGIRHSF